MIALGEAVWSRESGTGPQCATFFHSFWPRSDRPGTRDGEQSLPLPQVKLDSENAFNKLQYPEPSLRLVHAANLHQNNFAYRAAFTCV